MNNQVWFGSNNSGRSLELPGSQGLRPFGVGLCLLIAVASWVGGLGGALAFGQPADFRASFSAIPSSESGIDFVHTDGASGDRYVVETVLGSLALFDYDGDGLIDIYLINGAPLPPFASFSGSGTQPSGSGTQPSGSARSPVVARRWGRAGGRASESLVPEFGGISLCRRDGPIGLGGRGVWHGGRRGGYRQ
jgi:hypothetical protein